MQYLKTLEANKSILTEPQKARVNYLRLILINSDTLQIKELEKRMFSAPDTLGYTKGLMYSARKYLEKSMPDKAVPLLMLALDTLEEGSDDADFCMIELCEAYREKREHKAGIEMLVDILSGKNPISDKNRAYAYNRLAALYNEWGNPDGIYSDSVFKYSNLCLSLSEKTGSISNLAFSQNELSVQFSRKGKFADALMMSQMAVANFIQEGMKFSAMNALFNQCRIYMDLLDYYHAELAIKRALGLCEIEENRNLYMRFYAVYAEIMSLTGKFHDAYDFLKISSLLQNYFFEDRMNIQIHAQAAKFSLMLNEHKLAEEKQISEYRQKKFVFLLIILAILILVFMISFFYFRLRRKQVMKQKLIEAVINTEENERKRIARDLHDGLGPVLSAINLYIQAYIDAKEPEKETIQKKLQQVVLGAIDDVSRIAQNISPYILEKQGIRAALINFIVPLNNSSHIKVNFTCTVNERFEKNKELTIYRSINELISNTLKHAGASKIILHVFLRGNILVVDFSDDGKGFQTDLTNSKGMGLYNIKTRMDTFGGKMILDSSSGTGTHVELEMPL